jgi:hypothetical protein
MTVKYDDQLMPAYGNAGKAVPCPANNTDGSYVQRFKWEPGNGTRYHLTYSCRAKADAMVGFGREYLLAWLTEHRCMMLGDEFIHYSYVMEKMGCNEADAVGLLGFLERMGHRVGYPRPVAVGE